MGENIKIILADDHEYILNSISQLFKHVPTVEVVATAQDGELALELAQSIQADIIILDIDMPKLNGLQVSSQLQTQDNGVKVVILSIHDSPSIVRAAFKLGAKGYVLKNRAATDLYKAIQTVSNGEIFLSSPLNKHINSN